MSLGKKDISYLLNYDSTYCSRRVDKMYEPTWLIYAETSVGSPFTSGSVVGKETYGLLNFYREDLKIVNKQISGEKGIYAANLIVNIPRNGISVQFFTHFCAKDVLNKVELLEVMDATTNPVERQKMTYSTCKIEQYTNLMDSVELSINYLARADKYIAYKDGSKTGNVVSSFSG